MIHQKDCSDRELISGCQGLRVEGGSESDYKKVELCGVMGRFYILIMVVITQIHTCIKIHRTVYQKKKFYCASVIHLLPLCSKFILHCLFSDNGSWPFKYFSFASWPSFELCEQRALKRHRTRGFCLPGSAVLVQQTPAAWAASPAPSTWLLLQGQLLQGPAPAVHTASPDAVPAASVVSPQPCFCARQPEHPEATSFPW